MTYKFTTSFPYLLNRVGVLMGDLFSERLAEHQITLPMYRVLAVLKQEGPQRLSDLSSLVTTEISTLSRLISTMQRDGLLTRTRPEHNGRTVSIALTAKGDALVANLMPIAAHFEAVGTKSFTAKEIAWLKQALIQIHENLHEL